MKRIAKDKTDKLETFEKLAKKMNVDLKDLERAESVQFYPYAKGDQKRLVVTFFVPTGKDFPRYEELCLDEPLSWFINEIWKPQIKKRMAALSRQYRSQQIQLAFYEKLGQGLGVDVEELWNKQIEEAFLEEFEKLEEEGSAAGPLFSGDEARFPIHLHHT